MTNIVQYKPKTFLQKCKDGLNSIKYAVVPAVAIGASNVAMANSGGGFQFDTSTIITGVGVILAGVVAIGSASFGITLAVKAFSKAKQAV